MTYAEAAREALPEALQIADRFHLSQNLGETLERILRRLYPGIQDVFGRSAPEADSSLPLRRWEAEKQISQERRMAMYEQVLALDAQGRNQTEIAALLRMSRKKVRQLLKGPPQPPIYKQRSTKLAPHKAYLKRRFVEEGCENSLQLYREIRTQGYDGCRSVITNYIGQLRQQYGRRASTGRQPSTQPKPLKDGVPLPGSLRWWFHLPPERLSVKQQARLTLLCQGNAELAATYQLAQEFAMLLRGHKEEELSGWLKKVSESAIAELISFAKGLVRDEAAVRAGLRLPWNQGPVEGAVNRLKLIKRSMYGRAKFDLLRIRVLCAA
jgi:transposase